jgi:hypothetical protein
MDDYVEDRRKYQRYPVSEESLVVYSHQSNNLLTVKNISAGGLQFIYFPEKCETSDCRMVNIMEISGTYFCMAGVCCRIVYDIPMLSEDLSFSGIRTRVAGMAFTELTGEQQKMLFTLLSSL